jgi:hypothetical protein
MAAPTLEAERLSYVTADFTRHHKLISRRSSSYVANTSANLCVAYYDPFPGSAVPQRPPDDEPIPQE